MQHVIFFYYIIEIIDLCWSLLCSLYKYVTKWIFLSFILMCLRTFISTYIFMTSIGLGNCQNMFLKLVSKWKAIQIATFFYHQLMHDIYGLINFIYN